MNWAQLHLAYINLVRDDLHAFQTEQVVPYHTSEAHGGTADLLVAFSTALVEAEPIGFPMSAHVTMCTTVHHKLRSAPPLPGCGVQQMCSCAWIRTISSLVLLYIVESTHSRVPAGEQLSTHS